MNLLRISLAAAFIAMLAAPPVAADEDVVVRPRHAAKRVVVKRMIARPVVVRDVYVSRAERDGALLYSRKVLSREYAYPRLVQACCRPRWPSPTIISMCRIMALPTGLRRR